LTKGIGDTKFKDHGERHPKISDFSHSGRPFINAAQIDEDGNIDLTNCNRSPEVFCKKLCTGFSKRNDVFY
jgi:hypothetical protein